MRLNRTTFLLMAFAMPLAAGTVTVDELGFEPFAIFPDRTFVNIAQDDSDVSLVLGSLLHLGAGTQDPGKSPVRNSVFDFGAGPYSGALNFFCQSACVSSSAVSQAEGGIDEASGILRAGTAAVGGDAGTTGSGSALVAFADLLTVSQETTLTVSGTLDGQFGSLANGTAGLSLLIGVYNAASLDLVGSVDPIPVIDQWDALQIDGTAQGTVCSLQAPCTTTGQTDFGESIPFSMDVDIAPGDGQGPWLIFVELGASSFATAGGDATSDFSHTLHLQFSIPDDGTVVTSQSGLLPVTIQQDTTETPEPTPLALFTAAGVFIAAARRGRRLSRMIV